MTLYIITGPPCAGKSTWLKEHARQGDITIDFDAMANVLSPHADWHEHSDDVRSVTSKAWYAAVDAAVTLAARVDVYVIHTLPSVRDMAKYRSWNAQIVTIDPGKDVVTHRVKESRRPPKMSRIVDRWYERPGGNEAAPEWISDMKGIVETFADSDERATGWVPPSW